MITCKYDDTWYLQSEDNVTKLTRGTVKLCQAGFCSKI